MAALLPILQEILPMLMPGPVHITKAEALRGPVPGLDDDEAYGEDEGEEGVGAGKSKEGREGREGREGSEGREDKEGKEDKEDKEAEPSSGVDGRRGRDAAARSSLEDRADTSDTDAPAGFSSRSLSGALSGALSGFLSGSRSGSRSGSPSRSQPRPRARATRLPHNGVSLRDAIVHRSGSLCASVLTVKPQCSTVVFHNGEQEAIVYAVSGTAVLATLPDDFDESDGWDDSDDSEDDKDGHKDADNARRRRPPRVAKAPATHVISAGDFAFIPAWTEHQVRNESGRPSDGTGDSSSGGPGDGTQTTPPEDVVWVVVRNAGEPTVVPLQDWGGEQMQ